MIFPAVSFVLTLLVSIGFLVPFWGSGALGDLEDGQIDRSWSWSGSCTT